MANTSLYRRYRPETFDDVIGQDHIVRTLKNQIATGTVGHAYLFTGTRGTGKTTIARIFARAVNCQTPVGFSPCGKCDVCRGLAESDNFDIIEIDAASNNGVEQIRELTDKVGFPPTIGKYKVYIIDEVHMLTKSGYNAFLKTLEEPPKHAIFILATTEVHQIPATILSRCLRFDFRLVPASQIAERLKYIFTDNGYTYDDEGVNLIANAGQGSVRDALSIADMCVSYSGGAIKYQSVLDVLGASDPQKIALIAEAIASGDVDMALGEVAKMCELGKSVPILASDLATFFRNVLYIKTCKNAKKLLSIPDTTYALLTPMAEKYSVAKCMTIMKAMNGLEGEFRYSTQHRILLEGAIVSCAAGPEASDNLKIKELEAKVQMLEKRLKALIQSGFKSTPVQKDARQVWQMMASMLSERGQHILALAVPEATVTFDDKEAVALLSSKATYDILTENNNRKIINEVFATQCDLPLVIKYVAKAEEDSKLPYIKSMFGNKLEIK